MRIIYWAIVVALSVSGAFGQTLVFPHFANGQNGDGTSWSTEIDLVNTTSSPQCVTVEFFGQDGSRKALWFAGSADISPDFENPAVVLYLEPGSMRVLETDGYGGLDVGWVRVDGTGGIKAALLFRRRDAAGSVMAQAGVTASLPADRIDFVPIAALTDLDLRLGNPNPRAVGIALANPYWSVACGEIELVGENGQVVESSFFALPPRGQLCQFVHERFALLDNSGRYYLRARLHIGQVAAVALSTAGTLVSTLPVQ